MSDKPRAFLSDGTELVGADGEPLTDPEHPLAGGGSFSNLPSAAQPLTMERLRESLDLMERSLDAPPAAPRPWPRLSAKIGWVPEPVEPEPDYEALGYQETTMGEAPIEALAIICRWGSALRSKMAEPATQAQADAWRELLAGLPTDKEKP